jgi:hypothetical protein
VSLILPCPHFQVYFPAAFQHQCHSRLIGYAIRTFIARDGLKSRHIHTSCHVILMIFCPALCLEKHGSPAEHKERDKAFLRILPLQYCEHISLKASTLFETLVSRVGLPQVHASALDPRVPWGRYLFSLLFLLREASFYSSASACYLSSSVTDQRHTTHVFTVAARLRFPSCTTAQSQSHIDYHAVNP